jgi:hypothetical protein
MGLVFAVLVIALLGAVAFVRFAPVEAARWHVPPDAPWGAWGQVVPLTGAAALRVSGDMGNAADLLARLDAIALATARTERLAGSVAEGRITWVTRSALWGFPDLTTAELREDGLYLLARLRFGREDMGVNARRLQSWLAAL